MLQLTLASWRQHRNRYAATGLAVLLGVAFCAAILSLTAAARRGAGDAAAIQYSKADVVVFPPSGSLDGLMAQIEQLPDVAAVSVVDTTALSLTWPGGPGSTVQSVSEIPARSGLRWQQLDAGRFPTGPDQVAIDANLAASKDVVIGAVLELGDGNSSAYAATVVGLLRSEKGADQVSRIDVAEGVLQTWRVADPMRQIVIDARAGVGSATLAGEVRGVAGSSSVSTADDLRAQAVSSLSNRVDVLGRIFSGFALVAQLVAGLVIANTFRIVMTQRVRELALLRCVGATVWQLLVMALGEAMLVAMPAIVSGEVLGLVGSAAAVQLLNGTAIAVPLSYVAPSGWTLWLPFGGGLATVLVAALVPAWRAARVSPVSALRAGEGAEPVRRAGALRLSLGLVLLLMGSVLLAVATTQGSVLVGLGGGALSFVGVLALTPAVVPAAIGLIGLALRMIPRRWRRGLPIEIARVSAMRNPGRTAATAAAVLVGVTLISMMSVGAASVSATESQALDRVAPIDVAVSGGRIAQRLPALVGRIDGVRRVVVAQGETIRTPSGRVEVATLTASAALAVIRDPALRSEIADPNAVVVPVSLQHVVPEGSGPFALHSGRSVTRLNPSYASLMSGPLLVSPSVLERLGGRPHPMAIYVKVADDADPQIVTAAVHAAADSLPGSAGLVVDGGYVKRSTYDREISVLLLIATAMLGVAVAIALVGVGNTLSLSVVEQTREHGLLRALGLSTRQLRLVLAAEAGLMAGSAALIGVALGIGYGWAGTVTVLHGSMNHAPTLAIPFGRLGLVVAVTVGAGVLASVLPARRAVRLSPASAQRSDV